jgi:hypothetical protein
MYSLTLLLHSWLRWIVVVLGVVAIARAAAGGRDRSSLLFTIAIDIQFLLGVLLYTALSPMTRSAMQNMDAAMHTPALRFWAVEHPVAMLLALVLAHVGRSKPRRAVIFFTIAVLLLLVGMPWPGLPYGRPLVRLH